MGYLSNLYCCSGLPTEYNKSAEQLRNVEVMEPTPWCTDLLRDWYWDFLMDLTLDYPLVRTHDVPSLRFLSRLFQAIYALMFSAHLSPSSISSMMLLQQATKSISSSIGQYTTEAPSLLDVCSHAQWLYDAIDHQSKILQGTEPYPRPTGSGYEAGMKISFR